MLYDSLTAYAAKIKNVVLPSIYSFKMLRICKVKIRTFFKKRDKIYAREM